MLEQPIVFHRKLSVSQAKRINEDHKASVIVDDTGKFDYLTENIVTPKGLTKLNKKISILPSPEERVVSFKDADYLFSELGQMNVILTNACNLSCTYCYEQHNKDFGRFTEESLLQAYNFLLNNSLVERKRMQFFGGEPLIHKDLILSFLKNNKDYLQSNADCGCQVINMITNGILLTPEFMDEYFNYTFTYMMISLDTLRVDLDHREITQKQLDDILGKVESLPDHAKERIHFRCTLSRETAPHFLEYCKKLNEIGVRALIIHPLILDSQRGFIKWPDVEWNKLHKDILTALDVYPNMSISFSEGVGRKYENNCMIGSDMIAIDASGDYSGCYFFTNQKANGADIAILGNIFQDKLYIDRYKTFQNLFNEMLETQEQCRTCNYKNACYQCPAGNLDTGSAMFRPDDMCQSIVKLYLDLQNDITKKNYKNKFGLLLKSCKEESEELVFTRALIHLMYRMSTNIFTTTEEINEHLHKCKPENLAYSWKRMVETKQRPKAKTVAEFLEEIDLSGELDLQSLYHFLTVSIGIPKTADMDMSNLVVRVGYLTLLHMLVLNKESKLFEDSPIEKLFSK